MLSIFTVFIINKFKYLQFIAEENRVERREMFKFPKVEMVELS